MGILFKLSNTAIFGAQGLALFYLGAELIMQNTLTVGMLMAFSSYASTFSSRMFTLVDLAINLKMLNMHAERLADIVMEPIEESAEIESDIDRLKGDITLHNIRFRYAEGEPWIVDGVSLEIPSGQSLAITGPSGSGKSTLCKIILGLIVPTEGDICIDGIPIHHIGLQHYRKLIGTVMQDDTLLAGSILDNIAFFSSPVDTQRVQQCASLAAVHDEIVAMPMGYQTLVGDMGSTLSGGQKQRILLARALYKQPRILALDEATSHLDVDNERRVNSALAQMRTTRIVIAHRTETIAAAERVVSIQNGRLDEIDCAAQRISA